VRADHPTARSRGLAETQQEAVIDIRQTQPRAFATAIVHENLEGGRTKVARIAWHAGKLFFSRDNEMVSEVDASAGLGDCLHLIEQRLERIGRHQIGNECRDAAHRRCSGLDRGILGHTRPRDVLSMTEMQVDIDHAG